MLSQDELNQQLRTACRTPDLGAVKACLQPQDDGLYADIHHEAEYALRWACHEGSLEIVQYLLESSEIHEHATLYQAEKGHTLINYAFVWACSSGNLELVRYLSARPEFTLISEEFLLEAFVCKKNDISSHNFPLGYEQYCAGYHSELVNQAAAITHFLLTDCEHFPVLTEDEHFAYVCKLNHPPLIDTFLNSPRQKLTDFNRALHHGAWNSLRFKAYATLDYLTEKFPDFPFFEDEEYILMCMSPDEMDFRFALSHKVLKHKFNLNDNSWHRLFESLLSSKSREKEARHCFEFLLASPLIEQHIDLSYQNYAPIRYLCERNELQSMRMIKKKRLFKPDEHMFEWMQLNASQDMVNIFKKDYMTELYRKINKALPKKKDSAKKAKL